jgi:predicted ATPase
MDTYKFREKPKTTLTKLSERVALDALSNAINILVGRNNTGKTWLMNFLRQEYGQKASYIGPLRFQNFHMLSAVQPRDKQLAKQHRDWVERWRKSTQNFDDAPTSVQQAIAELDDRKRDTLFEIIETILGFKMSVEKTLPDNDMSARYIVLNEQNFSFSSSGVRILITLLTCLFNEDYEVFLIDEPELGISPEGQRILANFLLDDSNRKKYFPHIRSLFLATHSPIFLDRRNVANNLVVSKSGDEVSLQRMSSLFELNRLNFLLLGNRLEDISLPSAILLVEGPCEELFIPHAIRLSFPDARVSVVNTSGDGRIKHYVNMLKGILGDIQVSPYRDRIFPILDSVHGGSLPGDLIKMGIPEENIVVWRNNGIEYCYPPAILAQIFGSSAPIDISSDEVTIAGITLKKFELAEQVTINMNESVEHTPEFHAFLHKILGPVVGTIDEKA